MHTISHLASLRGSIANDVRKVKKIEREHPGEAATELQDLREDLIQNEGRAETIVEYVEIEWNRHTQEQIRMGKLEATLSRVDDELKKLKSDHEETKRRLARTENHLHTGPSCHIHLPRWKNVWILQNICKYDKMVGEQKAYATRN